MLAMLPSSLLLARLGLGALILGAAPQEKQLLRLKFQESDLAFHLTSKMSQNSDMNGQSMGTDSTSEVFASMKLMPAEGMDTAAVMLKVSRLKVDVDSPMGKVAFDSEKEGSMPPMMGNIGDALNKDIKSSVSSTGKLAKLELAGQEASPMGGGPEQIIGAFEQLYTELPEEPVAVGDSWSTDRTRAMGPSEVRFTIVNTLSKLENGLATIQQKIDIDTESLKNGMITKMEIKSAEGELVLDLSTGAPVSFFSKMAMDMEAMGMTVSVGSETRCERVAKTPDAGA